MFASMSAEFLEPSSDDYTSLAKCWLSVSNLIKEDYGYELNQSIDDLRYLQKVIDDGSIDSQDRYATECIGVAFGRVLATNEEGMDWWAVVDDYGRDLVIRYKHTSLQIDAMHMIGKRLEDGVRVDVRELYDSLMDSVSEIKDEAS
jgi:hypothetical protein